MGRSNAVSLTFPRFNFKTDQFHSALKCFYTDSLWNWNIFPGWDGIVDSEEARSYVPQGTSLWEFGTDQGIRGKADEIQL